MDWTRSWKRLPARSTPQLSFDVQVRIPYHEGRLVSLFHQRGSIRREQHHPDGTEIEGTLPRKYWPVLRPYVIGSS